MPSGKAEAMRPLPTRWQWDSLSQAARPGHCRGVLCEVPSARGGSWCQQCVPCVYMWWVTLYLHMLLSNKKLLEQIQSPSTSLDVGYWVWAVLVAASNDGSSPEMRVPGAVGGSRSLVFL